MKNSAFAFAAVAVFSLGGVLAVGCTCGDPAPSGDGGAGGGGGGLGGGAGGSGGSGGGASNFDGGACTLKSNGLGCAVDAECCSNHCDPTQKICTTGAGTCFPLGHTCQANVECCGAKTCAADATGQKRCTDESFCGAGATACSAANQCCSLSCGGCSGADGGGCSCQTAASLCKPTGTACGSATECCSNLCNGTCQSAGAGCATLGEKCQAVGYDANCCSKYCVNFGTDAGVDLRCAASSSCRARSEICTSNTDCCAGFCQNGRCPSQAQLGQKLFVGEPCSQDQECASYACASTSQGGPKVCQFLGGCRPAEEACSQDFECCGYLELSASRDSCGTALPIPGTCAPVVGVQGLKRCTLQATDKEVGEICQSGTLKVHNCCGGEPVCKATITGVSRCFGVGGTADGGCAANGTACSIADQCCSKICAPKQTADGGIRLECSGCVANAGGCTTSADCCSLVCTGGVCQAPATDAGPVCTPLGASCLTSAQCCSLLCSVGADGGAGTCITTLIN